MSLSSWLGMLRTTKLIGKDPRQDSDRPTTRLKLLTLREARFQFLSVVSPDSALTQVQPAVGVRPSDTIRVGYDGFVQCVARLARELTREDLIVTSFASVFQTYLVGFFIPNAAGMKFFELKKTVLTFKRKTRKKASGGKNVTKQLGNDVEAMLKHQSQVRTTVFSAIANYTLDDKTVAVLVTHLQEMQVEAETV